mmetsp:Transcript_12802/g.34460  ORF Transcript_12802/g.34460 Transcript_12802/m.34460 type:complete len:323 (-) Transcript_12802:241-1209(-)
MVGNAAVVLLGLAWMLTLCVLKCEAQQGCYHPDSRVCGPPDVCYTAESQVCVNIDPGSGTNGPNSFYLNCAASPPMLWLYSLRDCIWENGRNQSFSTTGRQCNSEPLSPSTLGSFSYTCVVNNGSNGGDGNGNNNNNADCFPGDATVELESGVFKPISAVEVGDRVRVGPQQFSAIYFWSHKDGISSSSRYVQLIAADGTTVTLSRGHFIYANEKLVRADEVQLGDVLMRIEGSGKNTAVAVSSIRTGLVKRGLYNPHTVDGNIVVNGLLASTYTDAISPRVAHWLLSVERLVNKFGSTLLGSALEVARPRMLSLYLGRRSM